MRLRRTNARSAFREAVVELPPKGACCAKNIRHPLRGWKTIHLSAKHLRKNFFAIYFTIKSLI